MTGIVYSSVEEKKAARHKMLEAMAQTIDMIKEKINQMKW